MKVSDHNSTHPPAKYASTSITDESSQPRSLMPDIQVCTKGIYQISPILLKELHHEVSPIIQILFQLLYDTGIVRKKSGVQQM